MFRGVHHVGLQSRDPRGALAHFGQFLGVEIESAAEKDAFLAGPNFYVYANHGESPAYQASVHAIGIAHICVQSQDVGVGRRRLESEGVKLIADHVALGTGFLYAYARDREGRLIEFESAEFLPTATQGWFAHCAFVTEDLERLTGFYAALLDKALVLGGRFKGNRLADTIAGMSGLDFEMVWLRGFNMTLEFFRYHKPDLALPGERQVGYTHIAFEVADLAASAERARTLGALEEDAGPALFGAAARRFRDPDGNHFILLEMSEDSEFSLRRLSAPDLITKPLPKRASTEAAAS